MLGIDPKECPEIKGKYALEIVNAIRSETDKEVSNTSSPSKGRCHAEWQW